MDNKNKKKKEEEMGKNLVDANVFLLLLFAPFARPSVELRKSP
jgi:hypothetical protein